MQVGIRTYFSSCVNIRNTNDFVTRFTFFFLTSRLIQRTGNFRRSCRTSSSLKRTIENSVKSQFVRDRVNKQYAVSTCIQLGERKKKKTFFKEGYLRLVSHMFAVLVTKVQPTVLCATIYIMQIDIQVIHLYIGRCPLGELCNWNFNFTLNVIIFYRSVFMF